MLPEVGVSQRLSALQRLSRLRTRAPHLTRTFDAPASCAALAAAHCAICAPPVARAPSSEFVDDSPGGSFNSSRNDSPSNPRGRLGRSSSISKLASNFESPGDSETASQPPSSPSRGDGAAIVANARRAEAVNAKFQKTDLNQSVARILLNDEFADANVGAFATLDLSDNGKFKALEPGQKNMLLRVLARGARVEELALNNLGPTTERCRRGAARAGSCAALARRQRALRPGPQIAGGRFQGPPDLSELSLDNQCNGAMMPTTRRG